MVSFGLVMEHDKSEIFHFSRAHNDLNPELDLSAIGAPTLKPKTYWRYSAGLHPATSLDALRSKSVLSCLDT